LPEENRLGGRVALITGAGRGIGREIALAYAQAGAEVILMARNEREVTAVGDEIAAAGGRAVALAGDVSIEDDVHRVVKSALDEFGYVDVLVNNAGVTPGAAGRPIRDLLDVTTDFWDLTFAVNCRGAFLMTRALLPTMLQRGSGVVISITSRLSRRAIAGNAPYGPSKAALELFTGVVHAEFSDRGVRAHILHPGGPVATSIFTDYYQPTSIAELASPSVIREAAVWLASADAASVGGQVIDARVWNAEHTEPG